MASLTSRLRFSAASNEQKPRKSMLYSHAPQSKRISSNKSKRVCPIPNQDMAHLQEQIRNILGDELFQTITTISNDGLTNSKDIYCKCRTIILKPKHAKLIIPTDSMLELEKNLNLLQYMEKSVTELKKGCYWLVDDMYKFEQIGYTKEVDKKSAQINQDQVTSDTLRYLVCAECNLGPLGWFDTTTKESYLGVW